MPNAVIIGRLLAVDGDSIILGGDLRIHIPPHLSVAAFPIGCSLTVLANRLDDERLVAESLVRNLEDGRG